MPRKTPKPDAPAAAVKTKTNPLKKLIDQLSPAQLSGFAKRAHTTPESLRIAAGAYRTGKLALSPEFAGRVERASKGELHRAQLSPVCAHCPHAKNTRNS